MTSGPCLPLIFNFTLPLLLGNMLQQTYSLIDAAIVGKFLGINALASVGASTSVVFLILGFCNGCCGGFGIPVAQKFGARDYVSMRRLVSVSLKLAGMMSVGIALITCLLCAFILRTMQTPENIFQDAYWYLLITFIGVPCTFFYNLLSSIIRALGDSKTPFWFLLFSTVLNVLLDLLCILVFHWEVAGAAIATPSPKEFQQCCVTSICIVSLRFSGCSLPINASVQNWPGSLFSSAYRWGFSFPSPPLEASCSRVPTMLWVPPVWRLYCCDAYQDVFPVYAGEFGNCDGHFLRTELWSR